MGDENKKAGDCRRDWTKEGLPQILPSLPRSGNACQSGNQGAGDKITSGTRCIIAIRNVTANISISPERPHRFLPLLLILFIGSGCSALIYEVVWLQLLQLVIGSSAASLAVLLGTFMGGMCLGSIALPRLISARQHPLRVYALLELGTGAFGFAVLFGLPLVQHLYTASIGHGLPGILLRSVASAICPIRSRAR